MKSQLLRDKVETSHYLWGREIFEKEVRGGFPLLSEFRFGTVPRLLSLLRSLPVETAEDNERFERCGHAILIPTASEAEADFELFSKTRPTRTARDFLRAAILKELRPVLGEPSRRRSSAWWIYEIAIKGWIVETEVDTGGSRHMLDYHHNLAATGGFLIKGHFSILSLLGISGQTDWGFQEPPTSAAVALATMCSFYLEHAARLLPNASGP